MGEMHRTAGQRRQADVSRYQDRLGGDGDGGQPEPRRQLALGGRATGRERRVLRDAARSEPPKPLA